MVVEPSNLYPARRRHVPKDFAWILRALSGVLNANSKPSRPRSGAGSDRSGGEGLAPSTKQPETTLKQNAVWETRYKREAPQRAPVYLYLKAEWSRVGRRAGKRLDVHGMQLSDQSE